MTVRTDLDGVRDALADLDRPCYIVRDGTRCRAANDVPARAVVLAYAPPMPVDQIGSLEFRRHHGVRRAYMSGSMAGGISSVDLVVAMARAGYLASFGSAGLPEARIERALIELTRRLPGGAFAANLIHSPQIPRLECVATDLYLRHGVRCIEASAFLRLTPDLVRYRLAGLHRAADGAVEARNRVIAKVSRPEIAERFARPAPETIVSDLLASGAITATQASLAAQIAMADDITVEADSGGHTDRRPLAALLPLVLRLTNRISRECGYPCAVRVGAAGGIGTPHAVVAALTLGAAYVVTGSINQASVEADTSPAAKLLLGAAGPADCTMAPAADMFEAGIEVQVLQHGTMFAGRAVRLYQLYRQYAGLDSLPRAELTRLRAETFGCDLDEVWDATAAYLREHDPDELARAGADPKRRMALVFRWYLAMSSRWAVLGEDSRLSDFQIWCGPAMGAFNAWVRDSVLQPLPARHASALADHLMRGAAYGARIAGLRFAGVRIPAACAEYRPPLVAGDGADREAPACAR